MNELLKELYLQAHSVRHYDGDPALDGNPPTVYWQGEVSAQQFAELIVQDCITQIAMMGITNWENDDISWCVEGCIDNIKARFGDDHEPTN